MEIQLTLSIVIPTYRRESVLIDAINSLLPLMDKSDGCSEIIIMDQTEHHDPVTDQTLKEWDQSGKIRWIRLNLPHITRSMNIGVRLAKGEIVLFLDDDILPSPGLIRAHVNAYRRHPDAWAVAGQVLQPWDEPRHIAYLPRGGNLRRYLDFPFFSLDGAYVENAMAGNLTVRKDHFIRLGGFDENFTPPIASRFETEFAKRLVSLGGRIWFEPKASIKHLRVGSGGTRSGGNHLTSMSPIHGVGDYYYALKTGQGGERIRYVLFRLFREIRTKFHLTHPWFIPVKLVGELRALIAAMKMRSSSSGLMTGERYQDD